MSREAVEVIVDRLGASGDGVAEHERQRLFIPGTLPGEHVLVQPGPVRGEGRAASVVRRLSDATTRVAPACRHFGRCGGCALQHLAPGDYAAWKRGLVVDALSRRGLSAEVDDILVVPPGDRRRAAFSAVGRKGGVVLGFAEAQSHTVVDLAECPVAAPPLLHLLAPLRAALGSLLGAGERAQALATLTASGIDLMLEIDQVRGLATRERLAALAEEIDLARLSWRPPGGSIEVLVQRREVWVAFDSVSAAFPPGAFLQASMAGETALIAAVIAGVGDAGTVLDLYAGIGTFSLPMARRAKVTALEGDAEAVRALAASAAARTGALTAARRDLARDPPDARMLERYDAVVFDPPRAGARAVAEALAASSVGTAVAVSCNPQTFARDARTLVDGGFRLVRVQPVDQFLWSPHVELVALFRREAP